MIHSPLPPSCQKNLIFYASPYDGKVCRDLALDRDCLIHRDSYSAKNVFKRDYCKFVLIFSLNICESDMVEMIVGWGCLLDWCSTSKCRHRPKPSKTFQSQCHIIRTGDEHESTLVIILQHCDALQIPKLGAKWSTLTNCFCPNFQQKIVKLWTKLS